MRLMKPKSRQIPEMSTAVTSKRERNKVKMYLGIKCKAIQLNTIGFCLVCALTVIILSEAFCASFSVQEKMLSKCRAYHQTKMLNENAIPSAIRIQAHFDVIELTSLSLFFYFLCLFFAHLKMKASDVISVASLLSLCSLAV